MTGCSLNRVRTAALKSIAAMQDRLGNIAADFGDVDTSSLVKTVISARLKMASGVTLRRVRSMVETVA